jgi:GntR family transcriptional regulator/MocR family aminotransferase
VLDLAFAPDRAAGEPVYRQLERYLEELLRARRLLPGERLPASRALAESLGVSRNTVNQAYQALTTQGLLRAHVGQGTFVSSAAEAETARPAVAAAPRPPAWEGLLARRARALRAPRRVFAWPLPRRIEYDLRPGRVDAAHFPAAAWRRAHARALARLGSLADAVDPRGHAPLREAVARALLARGIRCGADEVAIVNGAQQGLDLVARALLDPGDAVALEQPGWFGAELAFRACEAHLLSVGVDAEGLRTDELARLLRARRVKLLFTTPAVQSPTGVALSEARRRELLALADEYQLAIVEDDYDGELRHAAPALPALKTQDRAGQVIYLGTFSKALFPGLRVGYVVAPRALLARLALLRFATDVHTASLAQDALALLLESGAFERHVRRVRRLYAERAEALCTALEEQLPEGARFRRPVGGNSVWLRLPDAADLAELFAQAAQRGLALATGAPFAFEGSPAEAEADRHLVLSFATLAKSHADEAVARLCDAMRRALPARRRRPR